MTQDEALRKLNITVDLIPAGNSNRPGTRIRPTHITIHNTANSDPGADAAMHARYVKGADARARKVSWHFTVDDTGVFKHLPTNEKGWHAGGGNSSSIGIEVCENRGSDQNATIDRAALLTALMMQAYGIPRDRVVSHKSWTGKDCPRVLLRLPGGFNAFRDAAARYLEELSAPSDMRMDAMSDESGEAGVAMAARYESEMPPVADMVDEAEVSGMPAPAEETGEDRVAQLERMVGRLALENYNLRRALEGGGPVALLEEPEAD